MILHHVERQEGDDVLEGSVVCPSRQCRFEFPILDGIPILVANLRDVVQNQLGELRARTDLSLYAESLLGDAAGPGTAFDQGRYYLSSYGRSHWGDHDPVPTDPTARIGGLLDEALRLCPTLPAGPWVDVGCALGRSTFELATKTDDLVLGVDLNVAMLHVASDILRRGKARLLRRQLGLVYQAAEIAVAPPGGERVDFWLADATNLPLPDATVGLAVSLNVLDCLQSPLRHLVELGRVLRPGGDLLLSTPYDWAVSATPVEAWIGGHSQRAPHGGSSTAELHRILSADNAAGVGTGLAIEAERDDVPWQVYVHERASMHYRAHLVRARRLPS